MPLFGGSGSPNIEKMVARRDAQGLLRLLGHEEDELVRQTIINSLGKIQAHEAVDLLVELLIDAETTPTIRLEVIQALGQIGSADAVLPLSSSLNNPDPTVRRATAQALGQVGSPQAAKPLIDAIKKRKEEISQVAFWALGEIARHTYGQDARDVIVAEMVKMLVDPSPALRQGAAEALEAANWKPGANADGASYWIARDQWDRCMELGVVAVPPLVATLSDAAVERRQAAFRILVSIGLDGVSTLIDTMAHEDVDQQAVSWVLTKIGREAVSSLISAMSHENDDIRQGSARVLGRIGDQRAFQALYTALNDEHWSVRESACKALIRFGKPATKALVAALRSPHDDVRWLAADGLDQIGWQPDQSEGGALYCIARGKWDYCAAMGAVAVKPLTESIQHWDEDVREGAARSLVKIGTAAVEPLINLLAHDDAYTRYAAAQALGEIGDLRAQQPLVALLQDEYADIRLAAMQSLILLDVPETLLIAALRNEDAGVRGVAASALGVSGSQQAIKPLLFALQDEEPEVRAQVATALGELGSEGALQSLLSMKNDPSDQVRAAVGAAVKRIDSSQVSS